MSNRGMSETMDHLSDRFWSKVSCGNRNDCWTWNAGCDLDGYALFKFYRKTMRGARVAMILTHGSIPKGKWVLHKCDNPKCVNPDHLFFGTPSENSLDRERKGRGRDTVGTANGYSKLTDESVRRIREMYVPCRRQKNRPGPTQKEIAKQFGVTRALISKVVSGEIWTHVPTKPCQKSNRNARF